jgi:hypothetical protein
MEHLNVPLYRLKQQMTSLLVLVPALLLALICARLISNWRSLSKAPGPTLAGATDLWRAYQQYNGKLRQKILDLHSQCGPIVRYGVRSISISDPEVINVVYGSRAGFVTVGVPYLSHFCTQIPNLDYRQIHTRC